MTQDGSNGDFFFQERDTNERLDDARARNRMVDQQIRGRGVEDRAVLRAMRRVPRHRFVPAQAVASAYEDAPLPIGEGQTISQPYVVALMVAALRLGPDDRVLDVGCGSGYAAAVMAEIAAEVIGVERHSALVESAAERLRSLGYDNAAVQRGNGSIGMPERAPFDAISVAAGAPQLAEALVGQLGPGGRMVVPIGATQRDQELILITKDGADAPVRTSLGKVSFVPLVGEAGWEDEEN